MRIFSLPIFAFGRLTEPGIQLVARIEGSVKLRRRRFGLIEMPDVVLSRKLLATRF